VDKSYDICGRCAGKRWSGTLHTDRPSHLYVAWPKVEVTEDDTDSDEDSDPEKEPEPEAEEEDEEQPDAEDIQMNDKNVQEMSGLSKQKFRDEKARLEKIGMWDPQLDGMHIGEYQIGSGKRKHLYVKRTKERYRTGPVLREQAAQFRAMFTLAIHLTDVTISECEVKEQTLLLNRIIPARRLLAARQSSSSSSSNLDEFKAKIPDLFELNNEQLAKQLEKLEQYRDMLIHQIPVAEQEKAQYYEHMIQLLDIYYDELPRRRVATQSPSSSSSSSSASAPIVVSDDDNKNIVEVKDDENDEDIPVIGDDEAPETNEKDLEVECVDAKKKLKEQFIDSSTTTVISSFASKKPVQFAAAAQGLNYLARLQRSMPDFMDAKANSDFNEITNELEQNDMFLFKSAQDYKEHEWTARPDAVEESRQAEESKRKKRIENRKKKGQGPSRADAADPNYAIHKGSPTASCSDRPGGKNLKKIEEDQKKTIINELKSAESLRKRKRLTKNAEDITTSDDIPSGADDGGSSASSSSSSSSSTAPHLSDHSYVVPPPTDRSPKKPRRVVPGKATGTSTAGRIDIDLTSSLE
jgi:hypothetical protein